MSPLRRMWRRVPGNVAQWLIVGWVVGISVAVSIMLAGYLTFRTAQCEAWRGAASSKILPSTGEPGRNGVRYAAAAYQAAGCESRTGPLPPVDPAAYLPAPPPPTPSGSGPSGPTGPAGPSGPSGPPGASAPAPPAPTR